MREIDEIDAGSDGPHDLGPHKRDGRADCGENLGMARQQQRTLEPSCDLGNEGGSCSAERDQRNVGRNGDVAEELVDTGPQGLDQAQARQALQGAGGRVGD